jgi:phospholipase C
VAFALAVVAIQSAGAGAASVRTRSSPIQHVVIIYQENHSFDNVLGAFCLHKEPVRCDGADTGLLPNGQQIALGGAADLVPAVDHGTSAQKAAIDGGKMDGFGRINGCTATVNYRCYTQFDPEQIPNLSALADAFVVSDRTFQMEAIPSFGAHLELASATLDGFVGSNPIKGQERGPTGNGWGCDSGLDAKWVDPRTKRVIAVPSCVPDKNGKGAYKKTPVSYVPTIMDRLEEAGLSWRFYAGNGAQGPRSGYIWAICPTFAECLNSSQSDNVVPEDVVLQDASSGNLPNFSIVLPNSATGETSQHNGTSMAFGDNYIGEVVSAIENGPNWDSTAIFITYDDCGCFYDHVPPPAGMGIREPMVIVSPFAKPGFTDSNVATFASMLAFTEHTFGLAPLASADAAAYDYSNSFNFFQRPQGGVQMVYTRVPAWELRWIAQNPQIDGT